MFEKVMDRVLHHLNSSDIQVKEQFGFTKMLPTNKATHMISHQAVHVLCIKSHVHRVEPLKFKCVFTNNSQFQVT